MAAGLYLVGAVLCASVVLLPHVRSPTGVGAIGVIAVITAFVLVGLARAGRAGFRVAFFADLFGIVLIGLLCAWGGGANSPFALIYVFATAHAAAFQSRSRLYLVLAAALIAFLTPLAYESHVHSTFAAVALVGIVLGLMTSTAVHFALNGIREQRRRMQFLIRASAGLDRSLDPAQTLRSIAAMAVPQLAAACVIDVFDESGSVDSTVAAAADPTVALEIEEYGRHQRGSSQERDALERLLADAHAQAERKGHGSEANGAPTTDSAALEAERHALQMQGAGYMRGAAFPMIARGRTHGVISFWRTQEAAPYGRGLLAVLEDLSGRAALAFDNARLYAERAQVARTLRRSLMPSALPSIPGLELASYFRPMGAGNEVGGDFYDVIGERDGCWLIVGDVCGKGAEAAALTGFVRHTAAAYAREGARPGVVFSRVNRAMLEQDFNGCFATAILARVRFRGTDAELTVAAAGHPAALLARADGEVLELGGSGTLLGVFPDTEIEEATTILRPGDGLALYTDGLTEAHAPRQVVSVKEMIERLQRTPRHTPQDAIDALLGLIEPGGGVGDDIAILAAQLDRRSRVHARVGALA